MRWHGERSKEQRMSPYSEFAPNTDKDQLLGVDPSRRLHCLRKQFLDEGVLAHSNELLKAGMEGIIVLLQETFLRIQK